MKPILIALFLFSCSKEIDRCLELIFVATTYEGERITEELTTNFGRVCGEELKYYRGVIAGQPARGVMICPPVWGRWVLKK